MNPRKDAANDAVCACQRAETELSEVCDFLNEQVGGNIELSASDCRHLAELCRDLGVKVGYALARIQVSAGIFRTLSYDTETEGETDAG